MKKTYKCKSENELVQIGQELLNKYDDKKVFAFFGPMGVGKTSFIKIICKLLEVEDYVTSPTFSIINEYKTRNCRRLYHFDFYRVNDINEVLNLGYEEYLFNEEYCFIEWADKIKQLLPDNAVIISMKEEGQQRYITF